MSEWISLIDLPDGCDEAVQEVFSDVDGEELLAFIPKMLQKMLRRAGVEEPEPVAGAILRQRQRDLDKSTAAARPTAAGANAPAPECPVCMEPYREDESGRHVPRIMQCGHSACHDCFARMLRPIVATSRATSRSWSARSVVW